MFLFNEYVHLSIHFELDASHIWAYGIVFRKPIHQIYPLLASIIVFIKNPSCEKLLQHYYAMVWHNWVDILDLRVKLSLAQTIPEWDKENSATWSLKIGIAKPVSSQTQIVIWSFNVCWMGESWTKVSYPPAHNLTNYSRKTNFIPPDINCALFRKQ